jgi:hypothetical protein
MGCVVKLLPKFVIALVVVFSVGFKFVAFSRIPKPNGLIEQRLENFFSQNGYSVELPEKGADPFFLSLRSGSCSMRVYLASPEGWHRFIIGQQRLPLETTFFIFNGIKYVDQPIWTTWFSYQEWRLSILFGQRPPMKPVLGVNLSSECAKAALPWNEISQIPM